MKINSQRRLQFALLLSLFLHGAFTVVFFFKASRTSTPAQNIEVQFVETPPVAAVEKQTQAIPPTEQQVVDQSEKALNDEKPEDARFLSANNQVVKKQTIAKNHGEFKNAGKNQNINNKEGAPQKQMDLQKFVPKLDVSKSIKDRLEREVEYEKTAEADAVKKMKEKERQPTSASSGRRPNESGGVGSATLDYIKDLDPSTETLLSTREFVFYTYYARIRKQLNQHWGPTVRERLTQIYKQGRNIASNEDKITRCLVILDSRGFLLKVQIIGQSGIYELDQAAVEAFRAAAPFPNPPEGIIEADGKIKIRWDFILEA
jgi:TonB family protein